MKLAIGLFVLVVVFIGVPIWMVTCLRELYGGKPRSPGMIAIGHALEELDRLVTRPSVVQKLDVEAKVVDNENGHGGE